MPVEFWHLTRIDTHYRAEWNEQDMTLETVMCPIDEGHQRSGKRPTDLSIVLPAGEVTDFVWTWQGELLVRANVLSFLREHQVTGFLSKRVKARFRNGPEPRMQLWELIVTGWGGFAAPEAKVHLEESCQACGFKRYSIGDPTRIIKRSHWDSSDMFIVWPLPKFIFISDRLAKLLKAKEYSGIHVRPAETVDIPPGSALSPGRLSYWMPTDRAHEVGEALGIV